MRHPILGLTALPLLFGCDIASADNRGWYQYRNCELRIEISCGSCTQANVSITILTPPQGRDNISTPVHMLIL
jgi:hypothetical protein